MPQYQIELRTDEKVWDTLAIKAPNVTALRIELAKFVGELLRDHAEQIWADRDWRIDVTNKDGLILYVMQITASDAAATMPLRRP